MRKKIAEIHLVDAKGRLAAFWRPVDGSRESFLAAADAAACRKHPHLRELLLELAHELALNRVRPAGDSVALRERPPLPSPAAWPMLRHG
jgi:hypothetical protein